MTSILPWHQHVWAQLMRMQQGQRFPHALLLHGPHGVGKQRLAEALVAHMLCAQPAERPCGHCHSCKMLASGYHPDLLRISPEEGKRQIRIDPIREVNRFVSQTAQQSGYRVIVISPAEAMNIAASNALLKSLEEPGDKTLFILLSDVPSRLLPTIRSRCQQWSLPTVGFADCRGWLIEQLHNEEDAHFWWQVSGGLPLLAVELAAPEQRALRHQLHDSFEQLMRGAEPVSEAARLDRQALDAILWYGIAWLEDLIRFGLSGNESGLHNADLIPLYRQALKNGRVQDWFRLLDYAREQRRLLAVGANPNPQLVLEAWLVRWAALLRS
ncbi:DNA polymerase III subunit delta' [Halomonas sp. LS-001]